MAETPFRGQAYGQAKQQEEALDAVPMADVLPEATRRPPKPGAAGGFLRPTERPAESVMQPGVPLAAEADLPPIYNANALNVLSNLYPLADYGTTSDSTREVISAISQLAALSRHRVVPS